MTFRLAVGAALFVSAISSGLGCTVKEPLEPIAPPTPRFRPEPPRQLRMSEPAGPRVYGIEVTGPVTEYIAWATLFDPTKEDLTHEYTAEGLGLLVLALMALENAEPAMGLRYQAKLDALDDLSNRLTTNFKSNNHSEWVRQAFVTMSGIMSSLQEERFDASLDLESEITFFDANARVLDPHVPLFKQRPVVRRCFSAAVAPLARLAGLEPPPPQER